MVTLTRLCAFVICISAACFTAAGQIPRAEIPGNQLGFGDTLQDEEYLTITEHLNSNPRVRPIPSPQPNRFSSASLGTVSVEELRHPLSRRAERQLDQVQRDIRKGDHSAAIRKLTDLEDDSSAKLVVAGMLGTEYLRLGRFGEAIPYLEYAARLQPSSPGNPSNLGYGLCAAGQAERCEEEVRAALSLDRDFPPARYLMGVILVGRGDPRALAHLRFAEKDVPAAHMVQALYYAEHDEMDLANQQMLAYLGPQDEARLPEAQNWLRAALARLN